MKNFKNTAKRGLALLLALVMTAGLMSLTAFAEEEPQPETPPAASENTPKPLPDLSPADPNAVPTEAPYLPPYEDAKEADKLDGEKLTGVNGQIDGAVTDANEAIDSANDAADEAAADANGKLDVIEKAVEEQSGAAEEAAAAANAAADKAADESLSLEEREQAAKDAADAADKAEEAPKRLTSRSPPPRPWWMPPKPRWTRPRTITRQPFWRLLSCWTAARTTPALSRRLSSCLRMPRPRSRAPKLA